MILRIARLAAAGLALALAGVGAITPASAQSPARSYEGARANDNVPGRFDYYVLSLSWSPTYCEDAEGARDDQQCRRARPFAFVVHGLWPQSTRNLLDNCARPAPYVPRRTVESMLDIMPSFGLVIYEWKKHGTCSGLGPDAYFEQVRAAFAKVEIPSEFVRLNTTRTIAPAEIEDAFLAANPALKRDMIAVTCDRSRLKEVRICMSRELGFTSCPDVDRRACRQQRVTMPPVRGG